jgi:formylglycine-generating enzyme required for sulfatase activity
LEIGSGQIPAEYPKGYNAFYIMKYEITQGQYTEFLNMLTANQYPQRYFSPPPTELFRYTITGSYPLFTTNRPPRACNYLSYVDGAAYADWAALRPITELEYEKACRGTASVVPGEFAWGTTSYDDTGNLSGAEDGTETVIGGLNVNHSINFTNGDGGPGPIRVGIFAATINSREGSGGTYYGVMEMSGSLYEYVVTCGLELGRSFQGSHGDGVLSSNGYANNADWPGFQGSEIVSNNGSGGRGGGWNGVASDLRISDRHFANSPALRDYSNGSRCGRTAE